MLFLIRINFGISIHAPTRGATHTRLNNNILHVKFQSTLPREERRLLCYDCTTYESISIHAPTRGATPGSFLSLLCSLFQSTLPREERRISFATAAELAKFQSTLPREERLRSDGRATHTENFNPRSHERSDVTLAWIPIFMY